MYLKYTKHIVQFQDNICLCHDRKQDNYFPAKGSINLCHSQIKISQEKETRLLFLMNIDATYKKIIHHDKVRLLQELNASIFKNQLMSIPYQNKDIM